MSSQAAFSYDGSRPHVTIKIWGRDGQPHNIRILADSGNDITLLTYKDAAQLGFSREDASGHFRVKGVSENPLIFYTIKTQAQIGDTNPIPIEVGVQFQGDGEMLRESLLGRKSIFENFDVLFSKNKVQFIQNGATVGGINTLGMHLPVQLTSTRVQNSSDIKDLYLNP